jgi:hypothetical protein
MLIELADAKSYLGINSPSKDEELGVLVGYVNKYIMDFCGITNTSPTPTELTKRLTSSTGRNVVLPSLRASAIVSVKSKGEELDPEDYDLDEQSGIVVFYVPVTTNPYAVSVTYIETPYETPPDLKFAALELVKYFHKLEYKNAVSSGQGDSVSFEVSKTVPNKIRHVLLHNRQL